MTIHTIIQQLRYCSDALIEVDSWESFFPAVEATTGLLEEIRPMPYVGSPLRCVPPAQIFMLIDLVHDLRSCKIDLLAFVEQLDCLLQTVDEEVEMEKSRIAIRDFIKETLSELYAKDSPSDAELRLIGNFERVCPSIAEAAKEANKPPPRD